VYPAKTNHGNATNSMDSVSIPVIHEFSNTIQNRTSEVSEFNMRREHFKTNAGEGI